jgi:hypothetical protein
MQNKKTYLSAALLGMLAAAKYLDLVDEKTAESIFILLTGGGLAALRAGVSKGVKH